ncbi:hypothetical protein N7532_002922 [Penicillium argentinense]|uniref:Uncharacterized protein n=1 Tax=Penicillium argentinense TaxID=1131581 RepID=A0A9W9G1D8_9EURO|nr:uncharacterized protein N7532_002922 [Penicillium argentinense]KAJ5110277.1 hypothetical protein N7532_002922 [Penicillium argentinense]
MLNNDWRGLYGINTIQRILIVSSGLTNSIQLHTEDSKLNRCFGLHFLAPLNELLLSHFLEIRIHIDEV